MAIAKRLSVLLPRSLPAQMSAVLTLSFAALLAILYVMEVADSRNVVGWAGHESTLRRLRLVGPALEHMQAARRADFLDTISFCHEGYTVTPAPHARRGGSGEALQLREALARQLRVDPRNVLVSRAHWTGSEFSYAECSAGEIAFPVDGLVISTRLASGEWLNAEIHPHEWHLHPELVRWLLRSGAVFLVVGAAAVFFAHRLGLPLARLTRAAERFGDGLEISPVDERGPSDLRRAMAAFNAMQKQVAEAVRRRAHMLAAIGHDLRSPLTALRIKAELVEDPQRRADLISSIDKMDRMTTSVLEFLKGDFRSEPVRAIDLGALLEHEVQAAREMGLTAIYSGPPALSFQGRPDALQRAVRNLIENANRYAPGADVTLRETKECIEIVVADHGPGVPEEALARIVEPFERLSDARESGRGGFGLGLAIVKAVCEGHDGELRLGANAPIGFVAVMRLPRHPFGPAATAIS